MEYKTLYKEGTFTETFEKSKFIGHGKPVSSKEEALEFLKAVREKYKDATHNVPAIIVGDNMEYQWSSEDGEPQGTAGAPVLKMMKEEGLTNLIIVITRYFGGIKLGPGGLIRAYVKVAKGTINTCKRASVTIKEKIEVKLDYKYFDKLSAAEHALKDENNLPIFQIVDTKYEEEVMASLIYNHNNRAEIFKYLGDLTLGSFEIIFSGEVRIREAL